MDENKLIDDLINLSKDKEKMLNDLLGLTKLQKRFIETQNSEAFDKQIAIKEKYRNKIEKLDLDFLNLFIELKESLNLNSIDEIDTNKYSQVKDLKINISKVMEIEENISSLENENMYNIANQSKQISDKLKTMKQGKKVSNTYKKQINLKKN